VTRAPARRGAPKAARETRLEAAGARAAAVRSIGRTRASRRAGRLEFSALEIVGALLTPDMVARIATFDLPGQSEESYGIPLGLKLRDEIARSWRIAEALWARFQASPQGTGHAATARFVTGLLTQCFGFDTLAPRPPVTIEGRSFPIGHAAADGRIPVVVAPAPLEEARRSGLDESLPQFGDGARRRSAALLLQEYLNAGSAATWGLACDGSTLRLLRDNASLTRPAWIEANLARIFGEGLYSDFSALWLLVHASRFGRAGASGTDYALERWREQGRTEGVAARDRLREGVEAAVVELGQGFLDHQANGALRDLLSSGSMTPQTYYEELLGLVYRLIFLFAAEDRGLLHAPAALEEARRSYAEGYSLSRLRERSTRRVAWDRHGDAWEGLKASFTALARGEPRLGLSALGGLFDSGALPNLGTARLENRRLLAAVWRLAWMRPEGQPLTRVNWRDMQTEELGSVYESLLELVPRASADARQFGFAGGSEGDNESKGNARKTSGSYYTPDSLVRLVLDQAFDPVLDAAEARNPSDPASEILKLAILDPACGSGHFLLGAARRAATRIARLRSPGAPSQAEFQHALREVVSRCIYGVDRNPMAVELCKVALWIETVEPGLPLGFLDGRIRCGDSLLGVFDLKVLGQGIPDGAYRPLAGDDKAVAKHYAAINRRERADAERIRGGFDFSPRNDLARDVARLQEMPETTLDEIAAKRQRFEALTANGTTAWTLSRACDLYVAAFLLPKLSDPRFAGADGLPRRGAEIVPTTGALGELLRGGQSFGPMMAAADDTARKARAFHWPLEFPDVVARGGFDAVLGNPPWERIKLQEQEFFAARNPEIADAPNKAARTKLIDALETAHHTGRALYDTFLLAKRLAEATSEFVRTPADEGGRFPLTGRGDVNTYALFAEHFSRLSGQTGRAGLIVPTGIATDATTAPFFAALVEHNRLARLIDFENREALFPAVHRSYKFSLLTLGHNERVARFSFFLSDPVQIAQPERSFELSASRIAQLSPNTLTAPIFRSRADAEVTDKIFSRIPIFMNERCEPAQNSWAFTYMTKMFDMADSSHRFRTAEQFQAIGATRDGRNWISGDGKRWVPLVEAKMIDIYDHRAGSYETRVGDRGSRVLPVATQAQYANPNYEAASYYWVSEAAVHERLSGRPWTRNWLVGWKDVTTATTERTAILAAFPWSAVGHSVRVMFVDGGQIPPAVLIANFSSLVTDYVVRQKLSYLHLTVEILKQIPIIPPSAYTASSTSFVVSRALELIYTSHSMALFAHDHGFNGPPFKWNEDRRAYLRAELDAFYARAYGVTRDELRYILDPTDVRGPDYPSETFRVLKNAEVAKYGEYRTRRLVLEAWDRLGPI